MENFIDPDSCPLEGDPEIRPELDPDLTPLGIAEASPYVDPDISPLDGEGQEV